MTRLFRGFDTLIINKTVIKPLSKRLIGLSTDDINDIIDVFH